MGDTIVANGETAARKVQLLFDRPSYNQTLPTSCTSNKHVNVLVHVKNEVNSQLPYLNLTADDGEKYPDFCSLLSEIATHINKDGVSHQTIKDLKQAEEVLHREKHGWLMNHILYGELQELQLDYELKSLDISLSSRDQQELQELQLDYELKSLDISLSSRDQQFYSIFKQCLTRAEVGDYLDFSPDPSSKVTALGLTREELERQNPHKKHMQSLQQVLIPELEERLRKKCENLVMVHNPEHTSDSSKLMFAKSSQLPAIIESDLQNLKDKQNLLKEDYWRREKQFALYYQKLEDSLHLLDKLISKYKLQKQSEQDTIVTEWLFAKCDAMSLKIRLIELQILCDTYTVDTVQSLRIIRKHLDDEYKERENEKLHREQALKTYTAMGEDFDNIVTEFGRLKDELENKQWALVQFDKSKGS